jgi:hypothetical protein
MAHCWCVSAAAGYRHQAANNLATTRKQPDFVSSLEIGFCDARRPNSTGFPPRRKTHPYATPPASSKVAPGF